MPPGSNKTQCSDSWRFDPIAYRVEPLSTALQPSLGVYVDRDVRHSFSNARWDANEVISEKYDECSKPDKDTGVLLAKPIRDWPQEIKLRVAGALKGPARRPWATLGSSRKAKCKEP